VRSGHLLDRGADLQPRLNTVLPFIDGK